MSSVAAFYDGLADHYHLVYEDWTGAVHRQGQVIARLLQRHGVAAGTILDCACGIGTQAIGLALSGYAVVASDLSPQAVERFTREIRRFGVQIPAQVADFRTLEDRFTAAFDAVICCDNSLPHVLTDAEIIQALRSMAARIEPGGVVVIGLRDYDAIVRDPPEVTPPRLVGQAEARSIVFQYWDWADDRSTYRLHVFIHTWQDGEWHAQTVSTDYRALRRSDLETLLGAAGFVDWTWHEPAATGHHQPLLVARTAPIVNLGAVS